MHSTQDLRLLSQLEKATDEVNRIEDAHPPYPLSAGNCERLPNKANLARVIGIIGRKAPKLQGSEQDPRKKETESVKWERYFNSHENRSVISDLFWLGIAKQIYPGQYPHVEEELLDRIAFNYVQLLLLVEPGYRDTFFKCYYDLVAQAVYYSYFFAYPKSRTRITSEEFLNEFYEIISMTITGIPVSTLSYEKWDFDLGTGNILKFKSREPPLPGLKPPPNKLLLHMKYSPLVERYMRARRYEGLNLVKDWQLAYTKRNLQKQRETEARMSKFRRMASEAVLSTRRNYKEYEKKCLKIRSSIRKKKLHTANVIFLMNERINEIKSQNGHEYANIMVSLRETKT